jgi:hypothetical protein
MPGTLSKTKKEQNSIRICTADLMAPDLGCPKTSGSGTQLKTKKRKNSAYFVDF